MRKNLGFTFLELMVVLVIIGIVASTAMITISNHQNKTIFLTAKQLTNLIKLAETEATLSSQTLKISLANNSLQFYKYKMNTWEKLSDPIWQTHLPQGVRMSGLAQIIISPSGEVTPFVLTLQKKNHQNQYSLIGQENGQVEIKVL